MFYGFYTAPLDEGRGACAPQPLPQGRPWGEAHAPCPGLLPSPLTSVKGRGQRGQGDTMKNALLL